jgi:hypothetical protein
MAPDFGTYYLVDKDTRGYVAGWGPGNEAWGWPLDDIEQWLVGDRP